MPDFARYYSVCSLLRLVLGFFLLPILSCSEETCNGAIEGIVLYFIPNTDKSYGGERIFVDIKNKGGLGARKTLRLPSGEEATFQNVVIIRDSRSQFKGRRKICFDDYSILTVTCYASVNREHLPEIMLD